jgi:hypothetical protein
MNPIAYVARRDDGALQASELIEDVKTPNRIAAPRMVVFRQTARTALGKVAKTLQYAFMSSTPLLRRIGVHRGRDWA